MTGAELLPKDVSEIPVLLIVFNRLDQAGKVLSALEAVKPTRLYVAADGPRRGNSGDRERVAAVRRHIDLNVSWPCSVRKRYRDTNLGCKWGPIDAITWFFENEEMGVVLEDDCVPVPEFFEFAAWGLKRFRSERSVGMISGSNLIDYRVPCESRNGFSSYINIWGWATWRDRWRNITFRLGASDIRSIGPELKKRYDMPWWERLYWKKVFAHAAKSSSIWDFFVQYHFFSEGLVSVFPAKNLVLNVGFGQSGTHTTGPPPVYWSKSYPAEIPGVMDLPENASVRPEPSRDSIMTRTIWNCSPATAVRLTLTGAWRSLRKSLFG